MLQFDIGDRLKVLLFGAVGLLLLIFVAHEAMRGRAGQTADSPLQVPPVAVTVHAISSLNYEQYSTG